MMIPLLSGLWIATLVLVVAACRTAAHGERVVLYRPNGTRSPRLLGGHTSASQMPALRVEDRRGTARVKPTRRPVARAHAESRMR
jgi:hypothetical protein